MDWMAMSGWQQLQGRDLVAAGVVISAVAMELAAEAGCDHGGDLVVLLEALLGPTVTHSLTCLTPFPQI